VSHPARSVGVCNNLREVESCICCLRAIRIKFGAIISLRTVPRFVLHRNQRHIEELGMGLRGYAMSLRRRRWAPHPYVASAVKGRCWLIGHFSGVFKGGIGRWPPKDFLARKCLKRRITGYYCYLILRNITKFVATGCQILRLKKVTLSLWVVRFQAYSQTFAR